MAENPAGEPDTVLRLDGITKRFGELTANDGISLELRRGEILGLLGENGAGKTTLMNILFGHYVADEGSIHVEGQPLAPGDPRAALEAGIGMVHQHFTLADNLTVLDNIMLGTEPLWRLSSSRAAGRRRIAELSKTYGLAINPDATVASLSVGERQRVEILKALYRNVRMLILDEPTAVLTPQETERLFETLRSFAAQGLSIILISHKLGEIISACGRVVVLRAGRKVAERPVAGTTRGELAELMVGRKIPVAKAEAQQPGASVLQLRNVSCSADRQKLTAINLDLRAGEVLGIAGVSGNGQALLAAVINGTSRPHSGTIAVGGRDHSALSPRQALAAGIGRIPEDRHSEGVIGDMTVAENAISETCRQPPLSRWGIIDWSRARSFAQTIVSDYQVKCEGPEQRIRLLSGGNMQKLVLGRAMAQSPQVVFASQPTRGLDVGAVAYVHEQLLAARARGAGIILVSEDLDELLALSDRVAVMYAGQLSQTVPRSEVSLQQLGLMMGGQGFATGEETYAA